MVLEKLSRIVKKNTEFIKEIQLELNEDREAIKQLQDLMLVMANKFSAIVDEIKELKEDHISLRKILSHQPITGIPSAE